MAFKKKTKEEKTENPVAPMTNAVKEARKRKQEMFKK